MLGSMPLLADAVRRFWRRLLRTAQELPAGRRRTVPVIVSVLALAGATTGVVLATMGGKPATVEGQAPAVPQSRPAPTGSTGPVVPMLGGNADGSGKPLTVPVAKAIATAGRTAPPGTTAPPDSTTAPGNTSSPAGPASPGSSASAGTQAAGSAQAATVAPL